MADPLGERGRLFGFEKAQLRVFFLLLAASILIIVISFFASGSARQIVVFLFVKLGYPVRAVDWGIGLLTNIGIGTLEATLLFGLFEMSLAGSKQQANDEFQALRAELNEIKALLAQTQSSTGDQPSADDIGRFPDEAG